MSAGDERFAPAGGGDAVSTDEEDDQVTLMAWSSDAGPRRQQQHLMRHNAPVSARRHKAFAKKEDGEEGKGFEMMGGRRSADEKLGDGKSTEGTGRRSVDGRLGDGKGSDMMGRKPSYGVVDGKSKDEVMERKASFLFANHDGKLADGSTKALTHKSSWAKMTKGLFVSPSTSPSSSPPASPPASPLPPYRSGLSTPVQASKGKSLLAMSLNSTDEIVRDSMPIKTEVGTGGRNSTQQANAIKLVRRFSNTDGVPLGVRQGKDSNNVKFDMNDKSVQEKDVQRRPQLASRKFTSDSSDFDTLFGVGSVPPPTTRPVRSRKSEALEFDVLFEVAPPPPDSRSPPRAPIPIRTLNPSDVPPLGGVSLKKVFKKTVSGHDEDIQRITPPPLKKPAKTTSHKMAELVQRRRRLLKAADDCDSDALCLSAFAKGGLCDDEVRRLAWPLMVSHLKPRRRTESCDFNALQESLDDSHVDHKQIDLDVERKYDEHDLEKRNRLRRFLKDFFTCNADLKYFQGFHDICAMILRIFPDDDHLALWVVQMLSRESILRDSHLESMEATLVHLKLIHAIVEVSDLPLAALLAFASSATLGVWALSLLTCLFSHDINDVLASERLMDAFLGFGIEEPFFPLYMCAAFVMAPFTRKRLQSCDQTDETSILLELREAVREISLNEAEEIVSLSKTLWDSVPPAQLPKALLTALPLDSFLAPQVAAFRRFSMVPSWVPVLGGW